MRVHLGSDHAGHELRLRLIASLGAAGHHTEDHGPPTLDPGDDYPAFCLATAAAVVQDPGSLGIVIGGSGNGEAIAANKVDGARCVVAWSEDTARLGREHNDANLISLSARLYDRDLAERLVEIFLSTPFSGDPRHQRRIGQLTDYERSRPR
ncbi:MAG TPA: ribose-5-phosphate isomerase [Mycobacteriales bacterium]|jgi:ribose 5-phosphate isomerase B|nr:ribose-5-phosphate isomerase [Mycobacteriales bacterium]